jgi:hypothetical protein
MLIHTKHGQRVPALSLQDSRHASTSESLRDQCEAALRHVRSAIEKTSSISDPEDSLLIRNVDFQSAFETTGSPDARAQQRLSIRSQQDRSDPVSAIHSREFPPGSILSAENRGDDIIVIM